MLTVTAAAVAEPISLAEAKAHLRVFGSADDTLIGGLISTAREHVERYTGRALAVASYTFASTDETAWALPLWPATISAATYNRGGTRVPLPAYTYDVTRNEITLDSGAALDGDRVNYEFTTAPTASLPAPLRSAMLLLIGDLYENAEGTITGVSVEANPTLVRLMFPFRETIGL